MKTTWLIRVSHSAALAILGAACSGKVPEKLAPETILTNGKIVTVDSGFSVAEAVAIRDGKFAAVGTTREIQGLAGPRTEVIDLQGKTVLPGFTDGHGHVSLTWGKLHDPIELKFRNATSIGEVLDALKEKEKTLPPGQLLWFDRGPTSPSRLKEGRYPDRHDLDTVSTSRPILITVGGAGSDCVVNTKVLREVGVTRSTPQPTEKGLEGQIVKDASGEPTGVFLGWAAEAFVRKKINLYPTEMQEENIKRAAQEMIKSGITTVGDPNTAVASTLDNVPFIRAYQRLAANRESVVRVNCMPRIPLLTATPAECIEYLNTLPIQPGFGNDWLVLRQVKVVVNDSDGEFKLNHDDVKQVFKAIHRAGWQLMVHTGGGESFDVALEAIDEATREFPNGAKRHVITHARNPTDANMEIMKRLDVIADSQPGGIYQMPDNAEETFQEPGRKAYGPNPLRTYLDRGVKVMLSSDQHPVGPLAHIFEAVNRVRKSGKKIVPEEAVTVQEAIRMATIMPAYSTFQENIKGSIEEGKLADLIVLGKDILAVPTMEIKDIPILRTMIGGKFVYTNPNQDPNQEVRYWDPGNWDPRPELWVKLDIPPGK